MNSYITMNLNFGLGKASVMLNQCSRNPNISSFSSPITEFLRVYEVTKFQEVSLPSKALVSDLTWDPPVCESIC